MRKQLFFLLFLPIILTGCLRSLEKEGITNTTVYKGRVIDKDNKPLSGIMVRVTNGKLIHNSATSDDNGVFEVMVDVTKIDAEYYIQIGEDGSFVKRSSLKGFGLDIYDYGDIPFVDIKLPTVETLDITNMTQKSFTIKCEVKSQGEAIVTERGLCWSTNIPTIEDNKVLSGNGEGEYSSTVNDNSLDFENATYYARAYAKNEYGVGYGDSVIVLNSSKLAYYSLSSIEYGGFTYHVHPDLGGMQQKQGEKACEELIAYGFDDWFLPNKEELYAISEKTDVLNKSYIYWSSTVSFTDGSCYYLEYTEYGWKISGGAYYDPYRHPSNILRIVPVRRDR